MQPGVLPCGVIMVPVMSRGRPAGITNASCSGEVIVPELKVDVHPLVVESLASWVLLPAVECRAPAIREIISKSPALPELPKTFSMVPPTPIVLPVEPPRGNTSRLVSWLRNVWGALKSF